MKMVWDYILEMNRHSKRGDAAEVEREVLVALLADLITGVEAVIIIHVELSTEVGEDPE